MLEIEKLEHIICVKEVNNQRIEFGTHELKNLRITI